MKSHAPRRLPFTRLPDQVPIAARRSRLVDSGEGMRAHAVKIACALLLLCDFAGALANQAMPFVTPISLLDQGPASWAYELILLVMAALTGLCLVRWRQRIPTHKSLRASLAGAGTLFISLIWLPFLQSPSHDPVALLAMACVCAHSLLAAWHFSHPLLGVSALGSALAFLLVLTAQLTLVGIGEHFLLLSAMPSLVVCYELPDLPINPPNRSARAWAELPWVSALTDRRAILAGFLWLGIVVTAARLFHAIEIGPKAVAALAIPCFIAGAVASLCAACFPDQFLVRAFGAVAGFAVAGWTGGLQRGFGTILLPGFGLLLVGALHWLRQEMKERCRE